MTSASLHEILDSWQAAEADPARRARLDRLGFARAALSLGHATLASEILREPVALGAANVEMRYVAALAAARIGALRQAQALVEGVLHDGVDGDLRIDALSLAGRIAKDRWARLRDGPPRDEAGREAVARYREAWSVSRNPFPGINAATMLRLVGGADEASRAVAQDVRAVARVDATIPLHWREATLGEAALLLGDGEAAAVHYAAAVAAARPRIGDIASMRRQLRLLGLRMAIPAAVREALAIPRVAAFTGHMFDAPGRTPPRFPLSLEEVVAGELVARIEAANIGFAHCSAACGGDLLFIEALLARGAEVHVVLPFERDDFVATSVAFAGERWTARFDRALARVASVGYGVREHYLGDDSLFAYAGALVHGAAVLHARELESEPVLVALVDEASERRSGGSVDLLSEWRARGREVECIDLSVLRGRGGVAAAAEVATSPPAPASTPNEPKLQREVRTMLFADMVGYSRLAEQDTPAFMTHFLGTIAGIIEHSASPPGFVNTWGDGLFMEFDDVAAGARFALLLRDAVARSDWTARGLPQATAIRIGMHTGPVFRAFDPLIGRENYFGSHVIRAARIEPVAPPGSIYVSAELASVLAAHGVDEFAADFLGTLPLAKSYGSERLYRLRNAHEAE
ncbi:TRAFs-binding domain-containing protein [Dokdonella sp.]|uniref:TRAFs-binding domain-containing protein n=1 Tax=Dokdonella sp. TaxID=2291710 RepID=UPI00378347E1